MESTIPNQPAAQFAPKQELPGATTVLVLGIISLITIGLIGLILALIAVTKAKECKSAYDINPDAYTLSSYKNMRAGRVCGIISMSILAAIILIVILVVAVGSVM
ncbi:hypothetical protein BH10BAC1_BH10BAC1_00960 [soil metagenome]